MAWWVDPLWVELIFGALILFGIFEIYGVSSALGSIHETLRSIDVTLDQMNTSLDAIQSACEEVAYPTKPDHEGYDSQA
jgi:hypothetical protein